MTHKVVQFEWYQRSNDGAEPLRCPVEIPNRTNIEELAFRLVKENGLPFYVKAELQSAMEAFIKQETSAYFNRKAEGVLKDRLGIEPASYIEKGKVNADEGRFEHEQPQQQMTLLSVGKSRESDEFGHTDLPSLIENIVRSYREEYKEFANIPNGIDDDEEFSLLYHNLMHSGAQLKVLRVEAGFSARSKIERAEMDADFAALIDKQNRELETSCDFNEHLLNTLASVHVEERQAFERNWRLRLEALRTRQREAFLRWMMHAAAQVFTKPDPSVCMQIDDIAFEADENGSTRQQHGGSGLSESFTIHLGSQLKVMHNLRLSCVDLLETFRQRSPEEALQTSMCLYSGHLQGAVILVDNRVSSYKGIKREFAEICKMRAELHFPDIETQLSEVRAEFRKATSRSSNAVQEGADSRTDPPDGHGSMPSKKSGPQSPFVEDDADEVSLSPGDVYITRHSNLGGAHIVFHLVAGSDEEQLSRKELTSRHQVILGLRNILRIAHERDVRTLSIPLLLCNAFSAHTMTQAWCVKRAELVYKCVKGFMIEMASLVAEGDRDDPRTVEFIVPPALGASASSPVDEGTTFTSLSAMLQGIFRMANPLVLKTSAGNNNTSNLSNSMSGGSTTTNNNSGGGNGGTTNNI
ncbi:protein C12orf4 homolog isoform X2 [Varroa jacobsoni]|uniref:Uncharacterized protein n=1 Tax=Varroa destructor TaxID=109461 RepID=A0A7M7K8N3_VARDE|nr:protein C12orf4 homolog isoform X3 [Varroa destructor]XP_022685980.1 protein C12orf4 homolog isoform X2 [Varroa jacobsoni]